ncbi:MAG: molybdopterin oxidoreductase family protein [Byssovorax sp.]
MTHPKDGLHPRTCTLCEAMCGVTVEVLDGEVRSIRGDKDDPLSRGYLCPKAAALADLHADPDRLRHPLRRGKNGFERIGWDEAFDEVARRITEIQARHGKNAVGLYFGNPTIHNLGSTLYGMPFARAIGTRNRFSATSVDQLPHHLAALTMFGHQLLFPIPDLDRTQFLLIIGANPAVSNGSLMTAPGAPKRIRAIRERGGKVVVLDPRRTETAELATEHRFIRPGTDALLLLAMIRTLITEDRVRLGKLGDFADGLDSLGPLVEPFTPEKVAPVTGLDAAFITSLARDFAAAPSAACHARMGASTQALGGLCQWLSNLLTILTGNLDRPGGAMFTRPAIDVVSLTARLGQRGHFDKGRTRVRKLPEYGGEYPVAALAEEILTDGPGQIRGMITVAGNPVLSTPNGKKLDQAFSSLEFMVSIDIYLNETTRHASIILPPTGPLEHDHYDVVFHALAVRNTAKYSPAIFDPPPDSRHDHEIFQALIARLGKKGPLARPRSRVEQWLLEGLSPRRIVDLGLRFGPYGAGPNPFVKGLSLAALEAQPHGVDLGALVPCLPERLYTKDKRIALAPAIFTADVARARALLDDGPPAAEGPFDLKLIGRRQLRNNNSWMHNSHRLLKGPNRCTLLMHPDDARARGLAGGQQVIVTSRVGSVALELCPSDEMMPGVVSMPHGFGHDRPGIKLSLASARPGASINDLTDEEHLDALTGAAAFSGVPVKVEADRARPGA